MCVLCISVGIENKNAYRQLRFVLRIPDTPYIHSIIICFLYSTCGKNVKTLVNQEVFEDSDCFFISIF